MTLETALVILVIWFAIAGLAAPLIGRFIRGGK